MAVNDLSEHEFQLERGEQRMRGKSCPTSNPAGPWLSTADISALRMTLDETGQRGQDGSTSTMILDPISIVPFVSQVIMLEPGDLMNTGTPPEVGMALPRFVEPGDVVEVEIEHLGRQHQRVINEREAPV